MAYPELPFIYDAASHPCVPVGNVIEDNTYCHTNSKGPINTACVVLTAIRAAPNNNRYFNSTTRTPTIPPLPPQTVDVVSSGGGLFINRDEATVNSWFSSMSNNREACQ